MRSSLLNRLSVPRRTFDPAKKEDQLELKHFLKHGVWQGSCPFYEEFPWDDIPAMCKHKYSEYMLNVK